MTQVMLKANDPCWCGSGRKYKRCHKGTEGRIQPGRVSPMRPVPPEIIRPDYAETGKPRAWVEPMVKSPDVIARMRVAGRVAAEVLVETGAAVRPGVTTDELDEICHQACIRRGAYPSPLNYQGYPKSVCTSVNEVICHGIPDDRPLADGDIVNLDVTVFLDGVHGDTNATYLVGEVDDTSQRLVTVTRECLELGIAAVRPGRPISDIGQAIERHASQHRFGSPSARSRSGSGTTAGRR
jgi:methionyl aminopeptidase